MYEHSYHLDYGASAGAYVDAFMRVSGAIVTRDVPVARVIDVDEDGRPDLLRITVTNGELAPRVREAIQQGQHVVDTILVTGNFEGRTARGFLGQARLEFKGELA